VTRDAKGGVRGAEAARGERAMMQLAAALRFTAVIVIFSAAAAFADTIELRSGERIEGTLKQATAQTVEIQTGGKIVSFPAVNVRAIYFGSVAPARPTSRADDAIRALKALRSVAELGVSYADYRQRLADTKIKVDEYLEARVPQQERGVQAALQSALFYHTTALVIWEDQLKRDQAVRLSLIDAIPRLTCPELTVRRQKILDAYASESDRTGTVADRSYTLNLVPVIWSCASASINAAERLSRN
jgi:hypothetical protein